MLLTGHRLFLGLSEYVGQLRGEQKSDRIEDGLESHRVDIQHAEKQQYITDRARTLDEPMACVAVAFADRAAQDLVALRIPLRALAIGRRARECVGLGN